MSTTFTAGFAAGRAILSQGVLADLPFGAIGIASVAVVVAVWVIGLVLRQIGGGS